MTINLQTFQEFHELGLAAIPIVWDTEKRQAKSHPEHGEITEGVPKAEFIEKWLKQWGSANAVALKLYSPFGMLDFDLKNTDNKEVYNEWINIIRSRNEDVLRKVCIEKTRSGGFHVYIKYLKLDSKIPVARNAKGEEVISVYTGGLLSYCAPTPDYEIIHNDFSDLEELTDDEFDLFVNAAEFFNENKEFKAGESKVVVTSYPTEYETLCLHFDYNCTAETFEHLLNSIDLYRVPIDKSNQRYYNKQSYVPFLRKGSNASYSAKVYFDSVIEVEGKPYAKTHKLLIFSASMGNYPNWHDASKAKDTSWSLSPSKIVFYKTGRDWGKTIAEIQIICDSAGIDLPEQQPITQQQIQTPDRLKFPYDIFPDAIQNYIFAHRIQYEYTANFMLAAISTAIGNSITLQPMNSYKIKPVLYLAVVAPSGGGKSPAIKAAFKALEEQDKLLYKYYSERRKEYEQIKAEKEKSKTALPDEPVMTQFLIKDSTIEMVIKILSHNPLGCCIYADELSGFINRIDQYKAGDEIQKWLELHSGDSVLLQRITREANKVDDPFCNIAGGIQGGILDMFSKGANEFNGFYQRFLFAYPEPEPKTDWGAYDVPNEIIRDYYTAFNTFISAREQLNTTYSLSSEANTMYGEWHNYKNKKYNSAPSDHVKGIISKYQNYCLRFAVLIQAMHEGLNRGYVVDHLSMERAIRLTEYYLGMMNKVTKFLVPDSPVDRLQDLNKKLYDILPELFSTKKAIELGASLNIKEAAVKVFLGRNLKGKNPIFKQLGRGEYEKIY